MKAPRQSAWCSRIRLLLGTEVAPEEKSAETSQRVYKHDRLVQCSCSGLSLLARLRRQT